MKKKKKHRLIKWMILILLLLLIAGGILFFAKKNSSRVVDVYSVNEIKVEGVMEDTSLSGMITDHTSQEVHTNEDKTVKELYVKNGQKVKKGEKLLSYDMTLKELELKDAKINLQLEEENVKRIKRQLKNPKKYILENMGGVLDTLTDTGSDTDVEDEDTSENEIDLTEQTLETQEGENTDDGESQESAEKAAEEIDIKEDKLSTMDGKPGGIEVPDEGMDGSSSAKVTKEEIQEYVEDKKMELKQAELAVQKKKLQVSKLEKEAEQSVVKSYLEGVVVIGDEEEEDDDDLVLKVESTGGLYIEGSMNEYLVPKVKAGDLLSGEDYYTGASFQAAIQTISDTPKTDGGYDYSGMSNVSYYGFTAEIQGDIQAESGDDCALKLIGNQNENCIYIEKMFVRQENNGSYVYKENENGKLEKTKVNVGAIIDGYYVKILDGLTESDYVAFPYGKDVKDGAQVKEEGIDSLYQ